MPPPDEAQSMTILRRHLLLLSRRGVAQTVDKDLK